MTELSPAARAFRTRVEDESAFLTTCDGGDPGTPAQRSVWLLGIEPGWGVADDAADRIDNPERNAKLAAYTIELQLEWAFNRSAFKLLSALEGGSPGEYRSFASRARPFEQGCTGYLKANLFPEPCNNVGEWDAASVLSTGFDSKDAYRAWLRTSRFRVLRAWIDRCCPRLVIGAGLTHLADFLTVTGTKDVPPPHIFEVNGHTKRMHVSSSGTVPIAVIPHLSGGPNGLNSDAAIGLAADHIRSQLTLGVSGGTLLAPAG